MEPTMPRTVVMMKPDGSLSPGMMNFATRPATNPMMMVQIMLIGLLRSRMKSGGTRRQTTIRRILVYGGRQFSCQSREKLFLGEPRLLHQRGQHILSDS